MSKPDAQADPFGPLDASSHPGSPDSQTEPAVVDHADQGVSGLGDLPPDWPPLPANASLQVEISWVTANRLRVSDGTGWICPRL